MKLASLVGFCFLYFTGFTHGQYKRWKRNTNFDNPDNWIAGHVPCQNDKVQFPETIPTVYVQKNTTIMEMVLPLNGEIILGDTGSINFQTTKDDDVTCTGSVARYSRTDPFEWLDPENWCVTPETDGECLLQQPVLLDTQKVPCQNEAVTFPSKSSFSVGLADIDITVGGLTVQEKKYDTRSLQSFMNSDDGRKMFVKKAQSSKVYITGDVGCDDVTGCICGNEQGWVAGGICYNQNARCNKTLCSSPLKPVGSCCQICGVILILEYEKGFQFNKLKTYLTSDFGKNEVKLTVSKITVDKIQVVLWDDTGGKDAVTTGKLIQQALIKDVKEDKIFALHSVNAQFSEENVRTSRQIAAATSGGGIAGIVVAVFIVLFVLCLAVFCFVDRRRSMNAWYAMKNKFSRFGVGNDIELGASSESVRFDKSGKGFDNPMYGATETGKDEDRVEGATGGESPLDSPVITLPETIGSTQFQNPLYDETQQGKDIPKPATADPTLKMNPVFKLGETEIAESEI